MNKEKLRLHLRVLKKDILRLIHGQKKIQTKYDLTEFKKSNCDTFFGYYDITPFDDEGHVIYSVLPHNSEKIDIVLNTVDGKNRKKIAESYAWNWQQGCRLRWLPGNTHFTSFNDFVDGAYCNRIIDINNGNERVINYPLYDIDKLCKLGLSLDYERLGRLRPGYGYTCTHVEKKPIERQGVEIIDIQNNSILKVLEYTRIASLFDRSIELNNCYLNHLSFSPSGNKFLFFLIEIIDGYHLASLIVYNINEDTLILLDQQEKVSHYVWENEESIICTAYKDPRHCFYYRYSINDKSKTIILPNLLDEDGHPSIYDENNILTDTYPNAQYYQRLYICNEVEAKNTELLKIYSTPYVTGEKRTDLHPRLSRDKIHISFDANVNGNRSFFILKVK